jgi:GGDEF domain-containing protein
VTIVTSDRFFENGSRVLTSRAFELVLDSEVKRAVRSQNFLTLVVLQARREWQGITVTADEGIVEDVAHIVGNEIRDTDPLGMVGNGGLELVLLDADFESSRKVVDRLIQRIVSYDFRTPLHLSMGVACYPTHAVDSQSLRNRALTHPALSWRREPELQP